MDLDISQYISIFVEESKEHLQSMNDVLLELEKDLSNKDHINEIFRVAHTLKGMSGTMGYHHMANLTHEMENVLQAVRSDEIQITDKIIDLIFECFDALDSSVNSIIEHGVESDNNNNLLISKLANIIEQDATDTGGLEKSHSLELNEYLLGLIDKSKVDGYQSYKISFLLEKECMLKSARAFIIFNTLESLGEVIYSNPSVEDIEDEKFEYEFSVILITNTNFTHIKKELDNISEIESVTITNLDELDLININIDYNSPLDEKKIVGNKELEDKSEKVSQSTAGKINKTVRVDIERLDNLMNLVSELIIIKTRMDDLSLRSTGEGMSETIEYLERITTSLHDAVMNVRMVPIERVFNRFPRLVRDLSKELGKEINLQMSGEETEVDRTVIDEIGDPLIHLIRNSIDHGIELPKDRIKMGKSEAGTVILKSYPDGNNVVIEVEDDGGGIDPEKIRIKALEKGIINEEESLVLSAEDSINLLFTPGFSTSEEVSDVSGRGVGLDVVKSKIESINGSIEIESILNKGSKFIIRIPLTLAIIQALLIKLADEIYAMPLSSITEIINISKDQIRDVQGQEIFLYRGSTIPIIRLRKLLNIELEDDNEDLTVVVVKKGDKQAGVIVDDLIGQQEIVIKALGKYLGSVRYLSGATILGNGNISLILDINSII